MPFFERLVDAFYAEVADDPVLAPLYPEHPDFSGARHRLTLFLAQYWGGPTTYSDERGHPRSGCATCAFHIGPRERDRWLEHMASAVAQVCDDPAVDRRAESDALLRVRRRASPQRHRTADLAPPRYPTVTAIQVRDLRKSYGGQAAVRGVSLDIEEGEVYALLGHNGAGKSTIVEILEGHRSRDGGEVSVLGVDPARGGRAFSDRIGIVLQTSGVETELTVHEAVELYGSAYRRRRPVDEVIGLVGLDDKASARIHTLSGGQTAPARSRAGHRRTIPRCCSSTSPRPASMPPPRRKSWELIEELCRLGTTVLLTTHYLDEAEHLADRVGVLLARRRWSPRARPPSSPAGQGDTVVSFTARRRRVRRHGRRAATEHVAQRSARRVHLHRPDARRPRRHRLGDRTRRTSRRAVGVAPDAGGRVPRPRRRPTTPPTSRSRRRERRRRVALDAQLVLRQIHAQLRTFWRTPIALFFTIMLPLIMLVLFNALFGDDMVETPQGLWPIEPVLHGRPGGLHRRQRHLHQPRQHGADPA